MSESTQLPLSHQRGELEPSAFHQQLKRLESLQTLMTQGATVVHDVTQLMVRVREELAVLSRDHLEAGSLRERIEQEKIFLTEKLAASEKSLELSVLRVAEQELLISQLRQQLERPAPPSRPPEEWEQARISAEQKAASASQRAAEAEAVLAREREIHRSALQQLQLETTAARAAEISSLKNRLSAVELQLESERERRARLMEVVKSNEVRLIPQKEQAIA